MKVKLSSYSNTTVEIDDCSSDLDVKNDLVDDDDGWKKWKV